MENCHRFTQYSALDISKKHLIHSAKQLAEEYKSLKVEAIHADYMDLDSKFFDTNENLGLFNALYQISITPILLLGTTIFAFLSPIINEKTDLRGKSKIQHSQYRR